MANSKITTRSVQSFGRKARVEDRVSFLWDTELKGFGCRVSGSGSISWVFQYRVGGRGGKVKRVSFGQYPPMAPDEARKEAEKLKGQVRNGIDVSQRNKDRVSAQKQLLEAQSLGALVDVYLAERSEAGRYWNEVRRILETVAVPKLGKKTLVVAIAKDQIRGLIRAHADRPGAARNVFATLRPFFNWCVTEDYIPVSPMVDLAAPKTIKARDRVLDDWELKAVWNATEAMPLSSPFPYFYRLLILTGQRREEVAGMQWSELDRVDFTWTIPKERSKNGKAHLVHLSPQAMDVIEAIPVKQSAFIFTTTLKTPISGYSKAKKQLDELVTEQLDGKDLDAWRVHDLRRTCASGMARLGFDPHIVERVLNHVSGAQGGLTGVYQRYEYQDQRKQAMLSWGSCVASIVTNEANTSNVVQFVAMQG